jgi:hypothetical protein
LGRKPSEEERNSCTVLLASGFPAVWTGPKISKLADSFGPIRTPVQIAGRKLTVEARAQECP